MNKTHNLHFSIGPVQGFVAQARRTRDLWAGSFLLSWLSGQAMAAVLENEGAIEFPAVGNLLEPTDELLKAILKKNHDNPHIGSLPNRFKAEVAESFEPKTIQERVERCWIALSDAVWKKFVLPAEPQGNLTREIWDRQIRNFWEMQWVMGEKIDDSKEDGRWLDIRKNWRGHWPTIEGGDHCVLMSDYQELSGYCRATERTAQDTFWNHLRKRIGLLDLRDDERLCSIALVKRLFPKLGEVELQKTIGWVPGGNVQSTGNWPSTVFMASIPWMEKIIELGKDQELQKYVDSVLQSVQDRQSVQGERATKIPSLEKLGALANLDGNYFMEPALRNHRATPLCHTESGADDPDLEIRETLVKKLGELNKSINESASPYYALLLMDGDRLGKLLSKYCPTDISEGLSQFTCQVQDIVQQNNGFTIYAGGDDVLAILPINSAISCSEELRKTYTDSFHGIPHPSTPITASTAIIFSHYHNPLREVLREAHYQLDSIAKDKNGRDSLALALLKPSCKSAEWCATWEANGDYPVRKLLDLKDAIQENHFSTGFFYHLRQRYSMLFDNNAQLFSNEMEMKPIFVAEYIKSQNGESKNRTPIEPDEAIDRMLSACYRYTRSDDHYHVDKQSFQLGGVMMARFLAKGGIRE
jgi:CRISPR-associated protein Cmr2